MKWTAAVVVSLLASAPLLAQYNPPARDLRDAVRVLDEAMKSVVPAIDAARDDSQALAMLTRAQNKLKAEQPLSSSDEAVKAIDEFLQKREESRNLLGRDLYRQIIQARAIVEQAKAGPPAVAVPAAKERLHHDFIHPLQQKVIDNATQLEQMRRYFQVFNERYVHMSISEGMAAVRFAGSEVE